MRDHRRADKNITNKDTRTQAADVTQTFTGNSDSVESVPNSPEFGCSGAPAWLLFLVATSCLKEVLIAVRR
jgi:hypothetical protein